MNRKHILCFGDSNTWGYDTATGGRFDDDTRWTMQLLKRLGLARKRLFSSLAPLQHCYINQNAEFLSQVTVVSSMIAMYRIYAVMQLGKQV